MKILIYLSISVFLNNHAWSQDKKEKPVEEKVYTENEFQTKLTEMLDKKLNESIKKITPENLVNFSHELLAKEKKLKEREQKLQEKQRELDFNIKNFTKRVRQVEEQNQQVLGCLDNNKKEVKKRLDHLVSVISNMKPQNAADILALQDPDLSVQILGVLDAEKTAKIFNLMDKEVSARLQKQYLDMKK
jgi:flagellar motility protein MotE (MotC chaperone)